MGCNSSKKKIRPSTPVNKVNANNYIDTKSESSPETLKALKDDQKLIEKDSSGKRTLGKREILLIQEGINENELTNLNSKSDKMLFLYLRIGSKQKYQEHIEQRRQAIQNTIDESSLIDQGTKVFDDGNIYEGEFKDGMCHGHGILQFKESGNIYDGQFQEGFMHGKGKMNFHNGYLYEGDFYLISCTEKGPGKTPMVTFIKEISQGIVELVKPLSSIKMETSMKATSF